MALVSSSRRFHSRFVCPRAIHKCLRSPASQLALKLRSAEERFTPQSTRAARFKRLLDSANRDKTIEEKSKGSSTQQRIALKLRRAEEKGVIQYPTRAASFKRLLGSGAEPVPVKELARERDCRPGPRRGPAPCPDTAPVRTPPSYGRRSGIPPTALQKASPCSPGRRCRAHAAE